MRTSTQPMRTTSDASYRGGAMPGMRMKASRGLCFVQTRAVPYWPLSSEHVAVVSDATAKRRQLSNLSVLHMLFGALVTRPAVRTI